MSAGADLWSRRKARVAAEAAAEAEARAAGAAETALAGRSDAEILAALDLPDPDTLVSGDAVARFMTRAVPEHLRRRALRQLWRSSPVLANLDGLVDYDEDFTRTAATPGGLQTAYRVGRGMLEHIEDLARRAEAAPVAAEAPTNPDAGPEADAPAAGVAPPEPEPTPEPPTAPEPGRIAAAPRRMRFAFEG